ncbi:MAG: bifunctional (p)ppGpp synthetase/guanosine-3',5'-bis(diphosphate) 3'-pyrophosphohydrolase [Bacteroidales bacterium]|nr:bifunctional (p)ppGpp synthetase/guanosine-3',5'-bis(diphosphate) 3'-pyrophosphohydrolase [Bacteroidales bacterium]
MKYTEFTEKDFDIIDKAWQEFAGFAKERCSNDKEFAVVKKAYEFANEAHKNVRRRSGEPYILHPIAVAQIVVKEISLGYKSMAAALLHDVVEDTEYTVDDIRALFGAKIASLVDGLTKIKTVLDNEDRTKMTDIETKSLQAENFKRILLTLNDDVRVVLIKLADRLHNCRTIEFMPEHKRDKILSETMYVFIPLAHRLGFYSIKSEMENIWLRFKEPDAYRDIKARTAQNVESTGKLIDDFIAPVERALKADGYIFEIKKRVKTPYSIWHKMVTKHVTFDQIFDLYAVRIIFEPQTDDPVKERKMCYDIYSTITSIYRFQPDRLRDWIKSPKSNGYEALHCTLMSEGGNWVEVQIRSRRMDDIAEKGIAAHWAYKKDGYISENDSEMDKWLVKVQDIIKSPDLSSLELLDMIHKDLVTSEIVVFTPKGHQRTIPVGSTALDFAYQIHTDIGNHAIAAKVNMKLCTLSQVLRQGDLVEIITARNSHPKLEWIEFLQTRHARRKVMDYFKEHSPEDFSKAEKLISDTPKMAENVIFSGGHRYSVASCCCPIPGDPVIGFKQPDGTIMIHKKSCPQIQTLGSTHGDKLVVPDWHSDGLQKNFPVTLTLTGLDRMGLLNDITQQISLSLGINMRKLVLEVKEGIFEGCIELFVDERSTLEKLIDCVSRIDGIQTVARNEL